MIKINLWLSVLHIQDYLRLLIILQRINKQWNVISMERKSLTFPRGRQRDRMRKIAKLDSGKEFRSVASMIPFRRAGTTYQKELTAV